MQIDEAGSDDPVGRIDLPAAGRQVHLDIDDAAVGDADVGSAPRSRVAIDDAAVSDYEVV